MQPSFQDELWPVLSMEQSQLMCCGTHAFEGRTRVHNKTLHPAAAGKLTHSCSVELASSWSLHVLSLIRGVLVRAKRLWS